MAKKLLSITSRPSTSRTSQATSTSTSSEQVMTNEQLNQVVEAIIAGKYSWACVLVLRFSGYNPLHYIPYRTYNRLIKENSQAGKHPVGKTPVSRSQVVSKV